MALPLYPIKADPATLSGIKMTLGDGSVESGALTLNKTSLAYVDGTIQSTVDKTKLELVNANVKTTVSSDGIVVLDATDQSSLMKDTLEFTRGELTTLTLDDTQLLSNTAEFTVGNASTTGSVALEASSIVLKGALTMPSDAINTPSVAASGDIVSKCIRVTIGGTAYRIALHADA